MDACALPSRHPYLTRSTVPVPSNVLAAICATDAATGGRSSLLERLAGTACTGPPDCDGILLGTASEGLSAALCAELCCSVLAASKGLNTAVCCCAVCCCAVCCCALCCGILALGPESSSLLRVRSLLVLGRGAADRESDGVPKLTADPGCMFEARLARGLAAGVEGLGPVRGVSCSGLACCFGVWCWCWCLGISCCFGVLCCGWYLGVSCCFGVWC